MSSEIIGVRSDGRDHQHTGGFSIPQALAVYLTPGYVGLEGKSGLSTVAPTSIVYA